MFSGCCATFISPGFPGIPVDKRLITVVMAMGLLAVAYIILVQEEGMDNGEADKIRLIPFEEIRSVTFYVFPFDGERYLRELNDSIPALKDAGFNTIWIVNPWMAFNPEPLADPPVYDDSRFDHLLEVLDLLRENGMKAILGLNYLGEGWSPEGIDPGRWIIDEDMYGAFETYVEEFLGRIVQYNDTAYILFFTEATEPKGLDPFSEAGQHAALLRETLGSLPTRIDPEIRSKFVLGYHDYSIVNLDWGGGESPIPRPIPYDFVSMVFYGWEDRTDGEIASELDRRAGFFRELYPETPLIIGEMGASMCQQGIEEQARVISAKISRALEQGLGFNLWHWRPIPGEDECQNPAFRGLAITNEDGSHKPAVDAIREILVNG